MFNTYCICLYVILKNLQCLLLTNGSSFYDLSLADLRVMRKTSSRQSPVVYDLTYSNVDSIFDSELSMNKSLTCLLHEIQRGHRDHHQFCSRCRSCRVTETDNAKKKFF